MQSGEQWIVIVVEEEGETRVEGKEGANKGCVCGGGGAHATTNDAVFGGGTGYGSLKFTNPGAAARGKKGGED
eukprot:6675335-Ditylum_brightwellii.AAC.1